MQGAISLEPVHRRPTSLSTAAESMADERPSHVQHAEEVHRLIEPVAELRAHKILSNAGQQAYFEDTRSSAFQAWWHEIVLSAVHSWSTRCDHGNIMHI